MEEVKLICGNCKTETFRLPKEPPTNAREKKQALFHCEHCGVVNLRDGSVRLKKAQEVPKVLEKKQEILEQKKEGPSVGWRRFVAMTFLGALAFIFLKKSLKGPGGGGSVGNSPSDPGQGSKFPWSPVS